LRAGVEANLRSLRVDRPDLVNLRPVDTGAADAVTLEALAVTAVAETQNAYSVINRDDDALLALARAHQLLFVPFGPLVVHARAGATGGGRDHRLRPRADLAGSGRDLAVDHRCSCACCER
jgi:aryl-alcohol dehydrogenase-like predicted oxidoreductase